MKIRYHKKGTNVHRTTKDFDPAGEPLNAYRLCVVKNNSVLTGSRMKTQLMKPLYPDIQFSVALPVVRLPKWHMDWEEVMELQPEGFYIIKNVYTKVWDITEEQYQESLDRFEAKIREYLQTAREYYLPKIPDSPDYEWEEVDMTKPYRERYTRIPVEVGRYRGNFFRVDQTDIIPWFVRWATYSNPFNLMCGKVIKS